LTQPGTVRSVDISIWYGEIPPTQFIIKFVPLSEMLALIGGAGNTFMLSVAVLESPPLSVTLTTNVFVPTFADSGSPDKVPFATTVSHAGPLTAAYVSVPPFRSLAFVEIVAV